MFHIIFVLLECPTDDTGGQTTGSLSGTSPPEHHGRFHIFIIFLINHFMCMFSSTPIVSAEYHFHFFNSSLLVVYACSACLSLLGSSWVPFLGSPLQHRLVLFQSMLGPLSKVDQSSPPSPSCINLASLTTCSN